MVSIHSDGWRECEYDGELECERDRGWLSCAGDDYYERELHGARCGAESEYVDDHGDERRVEFGECVERGHDFESDTDAFRDQSGEHGDGQLFDHADRDELYFGRKGDAGEYGVDDDFCFVDATDRDWE